jgi:hypothetical protein
MYLQNKYTKWYYNIIQNAQARILPSNVYFEKHHIVPRSLGGNNKQLNIVELTPREHFICHLLLTKMTNGNAMYKMRYALWMLTNIKKIGKGRYTPTGRIYEYVRKCHNEAIKLSWTDEKRKRHSKKLKEFNASIDKTSERYQNRIEKISKFQKTKVWTEKAIQNRLDNCLKNAAARKGKPWDDKKRQSTLNTYLEKNLDIALEIISLHNAGLNNLQISKKLEISWDKVKYSLKHRLDFETYQNNNY